MIHGSPGTAAGGKRQKKERGEGARNKSRLSSLASSKAALLIYVLCAGLLYKSTLEIRTHQFLKMVLIIVTEERALGKQLGKLHLTSSWITLGKSFILPGE